MRVRNDHVTNRAALLIGEGDADASGVNRYAVIDEKARQALRRIRAAVGIE